MLKSILVSPDFKKLVETTRELGYGELFSTRIRMEGPNAAVDLSRNEHDLLKVFEEFAEVGIITVHNSEPVMVEIDLKENGFRCRKKIKLPTA